MTEDEKKVLEKKSYSIDCTEDDFILYWTNVKGRSVEEAKEAYPIIMNEIARAHFNIK
ncbi:MAG TPA: hypothetical protein PK079_26445 [Leptospiraceae bacterium]|nr:hypothetical protein [Leptospiraceae bacterium]HMZ67618.1 hypothetical protein [Leptospiraceae bacterium]HNA10406.1 hypothetical protein [Leptospiraceae bacterium]HNC01421.1 hypothetical protein [Leptospiraceae bacterium]HNC59829.1 hypothetical protein [Leptospiraceae bacterium]